MTFIGILEYITPHDHWTDRHPIEGFKTIEQADLAFREYCMKRRCDFTGKTHLRRQDALLYRICVFDLQEDQKLKP